MRRARAKVVRACLQDDIHLEGTNTTSAAVIVGPGWQLPPDRHMQAPALAARCLQHKDLLIAGFRVVPLSVACSTDGCLSDH